jgi:hypothetical protein
MALTRSTQRIVEHLTREKTLTNRMLFHNIESFLTRLNPGFDSSLIDTSLEYREALNDLKRRYPHLIIRKPPDDDLLSVNSFIHFADLTITEHECLYCGRAFDRVRSTKKYCSESHRVLMFRKRKSENRQYQL